VQQANSSSIPPGRLPGKLEPNPRKHCSAMILKGAQLGGPKGASEDMSLHDHENVVKKEASGPSKDIHDDVVKDANKVPKDSKCTSLIPYTSPMPFP